MKKTIYFIFLIAIFCAGTVSAELYKYVDENGNVKFTDDITRVPRDQRDQYFQTDEGSESDDPDGEEIDSKGEFETEASGPKDGEATEENAKAETGNWPDTIKDGDEATETIDEMFTRINATRTELKSEYESIEAAKKELQATKNDATTPETINAYNEKAKSINEQAKKYKEKYEVFQTDQEAYNQRAQEELDAQKVAKESTAETKTQEAAADAENQE